MSQLHKCGRVLLSLLASYERGAGQISVAATPKVESRLKRSTLNSVRLDSTRLGHIQVTRSRPKSTRVDGVASFSDPYSRATNDGERVNLGRVYLGVVAW
jgi:hypothetical protein